MGKMKAKTAEKNREDTSQHIIKLVQHTQAPILMKQSHTETAIESKTV